jgi:KDO2-lipid IV(A) lauroyltransferase
MAKPRSPVADYLVYLLIRLVVCVFQSLTIEMGRSVAWGLAWLAYRLDHRHRRVALDNLQQAFPGRYSEAERAEIVRCVYRHFLSVVVEIAHLPRKLRPSTWRNYMSLPDGHLIMGALLSGRPLLIVTGHFGNWEMAGYALSLLGFESFAVARPLDNPHLDQFLRTFRERTGQKLLAKKGELDRIEGILKAGGTICVLVDQDAGQRGLYVDFFGQPASTHKAIALLALEHRALLAVCGAVRVGAGVNYAIRVTDVIDAAEYAGEPNAVRAITQRYTTAFERLVRLDPRQYFWVHRRWKHQPQARKGKMVA